MPIEFPIVELMSSQAVTSGWWTISTHWGLFVRIVTPFQRIHGNSA